MYSSSNVCTGNTPHSQGNTLHALFSNGCLAAGVSGDVGTLTYCLGKGSCSHGVQHPLPRSLYPSWRRQTLSTLPGLRATHMLSAEWGPLGVPVSSRSFGLNLSMAQTHLPNCTPRVLLGCPSLRNRIDEGWRKDKLPEVSIRGVPSRFPSFKLVYVYMKLMQLKVRVDLTLTILFEACGLPCCPCQAVTVHSFPTPHPH